jgi:hypothetical protein
MTWFRVDDSLAFHAKTVAAGNVAMGLWVRAGAWCSQQLTDGLVPAHMLPALGARPAHATALVEAGLWVRDEGGYAFHDWLDCQPAASEVQAERAAKHEAKSKAGKAGGIASGVARRKHTPSTDEADAKQTASKTKPRPDPTLSSAANAAALHLRPVGDEPTAGSVVTAYCDGATSNGRPRPSERLRGKVGKDANRLHAEGHAWSDLIAAALRMGASGWDDLDRELQQPQRGKPVGSGIASQSDAAYLEPGIFGGAS